MFVGSSALQYRTWYWRHCRAPEAVIWVCPTRLGLMQPPFVLQTFCAVLRCQSTSRNHLREYRVQSTEDIGEPYFPPSTRPLFLARIYTYHDITMTNK